MGNQQGANGKEEKKEEEEEEDDDYGDIEEDDLDDDVPRFIKEKEKAKEEKKKAEEIKKETKPQQPTKKEAVNKAEKEDLVRKVKQPEGNATRMEEDAKRGNKRIVPEREAPPAAKSNRTRRKKRRKPRKKEQHPNRVDLTPPVDRVSPENDDTPQEDESHLDTPGFNPDDAIAEEDQSAYGHLNSNEQPEAANSVLAEEEDPAEREYSRRIAERVEREKREDMAEKAARVEREIRADKEDRANAEAPEQQPPSRRHEAEREEMEDDVDERMAKHRRHEDIAHIVKEMSQWRVQYEAIRRAKERQAQMRQQFLPSVPGQPVIRWAPQVQKVSQKQRAQAQLMVPPTRQPRINTDMDDHRTMEDAASQRRETENLCPSVDDNERRQERELEMTKTKLKRKFNNAMVSKLISNAVNGVQDRTENLPNILSRNKGKVGRNKSVHSTLASNKSRMTIQNDENPRLPAQNSVVEKDYSTNLPHNISTGLSPYGLVNGVINAAEMGKNKHVSPYSPLALRLLLESNNKSVHRHESPLAKFGRKLIGPEDRLYNTREVSNADTQLEKTDKFLFPILRAHQAVANYQI